MTPLSTALLFFPAFVVGASGYLIVDGALSRSLFEILGGVATVYLLPLAIYRWHDARFPLKEGPSHIAGGPYSPWWGGHQIQLVFIAFPFLETVLRLVPGLYASWLRAWGSKVGARVYFTPSFRVGDRGLLTIGDDVIFGYEVGISSHLVKKTRKNVLLFVKRVVIENGAFIGAGAIIGPGVVVEEGAIIDAGAHLYPNTRHWRHGGARKTSTTPDAATNNAMNDDAKNNADDSTNDAPRNVDDDA